MLRVGEGKLILPVNGKDMDRAIPFDRSYTYSRTLAIVAVIKLTLEVDSSM